MKKGLIIYLLALLLGGAISLCSNIEPYPNEIVVEHHGVEVDWRLEDLFDEFTLLMDENDIEIDYTKLEKIVVIPLDKRFNGLYWEDVVYLSINITVPKGTSPELEKDFVLYTLAHEIAHSQGMTHTPNNPWHLMYNGADFAIANIKAKGIEEIILNAYCPKPIPTK